MMQDNKSTILLEENGKASSGKRTRHINIRYYFITDCVEKGLLTIKYCPTDDMWADFLTKPLQGKKFISFRALLMNLCDVEKIEKEADQRKAAIANGPIHGKTLLNNSIKIKKLNNTNTTTCTIKNNELPAIQYCKTGKSQVHTIRSDAKTEFLRQ